MSHDLIVLHGGLSTDLCQGQCEGQGVEVGVGVEGGGEGGQGEGEEGGHQVHQVRHPQQHQQPGHTAQDMHQMALGVGGNTVLYRSVSTCGKFCGISVWNKLRLRSD